MSDRGFIAVDRGLWDNTTFANDAFSEREAWVWLIAEAAWQPKTVRVGSAVVELSRGECCYSTRFLAEKWKWSQPSVRRFLRKLEQANQVALQTGSGATQISVCNYDVYQSSKNSGGSPAAQPRLKEKQVNKPSNEGSSNQDERVTALCEVLDEEHAAALHEHRLLKAKKTWTPRAARMMAKELGRATDIGITANDASEAIVRNGWTGFEIGWLAKRHSVGPRLVHHNDRPPPEEHPRTQLRRALRGNSYDRPVEDNPVIEGQAVRYR